jgi:hypothetical protein
MRYPKASGLQKAIRQCQAIEKKLAENHGPIQKIEQIREAIRLLRSEDPMDQVLSTHLIKEASSDDRDPN